MFLRYPMRSFRSDLAITSTVAAALAALDAALERAAPAKAKIEARPAYQRMLAKARPDGMVGALPALPAHAPSGPRPAPAAPAATPPR